VAKQTGPAIDYEVLANFRYEIRRFLNFSERAARAAGLEPHQHQALLATKGLQVGWKATIGFLAERLQIQHHSAVELTDRLEASGIIRRSRNQSDRREVLLQLTPRGEKLLRGLSVCHREELRLTGPRLLEALKKAAGSHSRRTRNPLYQSGLPDGAARHRRIQSK
jgi:DNA-binding MarR family transcriptional regulator